MLLKTSDGDHRDESDIEKCVVGSLLPLNSWRIVEQLLKLMDWIYQVLEYRGTN